MDDSEELKERLQSLEKRAIQRFKLIKFGLVTIGSISIFSGLTIVRGLSLQYQDHSWSYSFKISGNDSWGDLLAVPTFGTTIYTLVASLLKDKDHK